MWTTECTLYLVNMFVCVCELENIFFAELKQIQIHIPIRIIGIR